MQHLFKNWLVIHTKWFEKYDHHLCINNIFSLKVWFVEGVIICFILFVWGFGDCRWRAANFDLCSASWPLKFFSVSQLLWHGASVYNGHIRGHVTLTPMAERLAVELSPPVFTTLVCRGWDLHTQPSACEDYALTHCATAAVDNEPHLISST